MLRIILVVVLAVAGGCMDSPEADTPANRLVSVEWLEDNLGAAGLVVVDARPSREYAEGHIPGAISASFPIEESSSHGVYVSYGGGLDLWGDTDNPVPFQDASPEEVQDAVRSLGISNESTVVVYDAGAHFHAARAFFTLNFHGLKKVHVLDGGLYKWNDEGFDTTTDVPDVERGNFVARVENAGWKVDTDYVLAATTDPNVQLMHSLPASWHYGGYLAYSRPGHIPNSTMLPMGFFFRSDRTWKSPAELRTLFTAQGIDLERELVTYCGGNPLSACTFFTAKYVMGLENVKNYHGSITAWVEDPRNLPLNTYQNPNWLRDSDWMRWFAGARMQHLLQDPPALVVDVRDANSYEAGHIAWSVNLPMDEVTSPRLDDADHWADQLGSIGIGGPIEAVLCDQSVTPNLTALFFVLDHLGHDEVSICVDGLSGWSADGYPLTDEETPIAEPTQRIDVAVHPKSFGVDRRDASVVPDLVAEAVPPFSRVVVVASQEIPAELASREVVHVPWTQSFDENGALRSAADLWAPYEEAGVHIFSDVAIYAPSWKEATVNYFVLRLLGLQRVGVVLP